MSKPRKSSTWHIHRIGFTVVVEAANVGKGIIGIYQTTDCCELDTQQAQEAYSRKYLKNSGAVFNVV